MKKMVMLMVILGITSLAGAAVDIYLTDGQGNSNIQLTPSQTTMLYLWYSGDDIISFDLEVGKTGPGTILGGAITATGRNSEYDGTPMPGMVYGYDIELTGSADSVALGKTVTNALATIEFHCDGMGPVNLSLYDIATFDLGWGQLTPILHGMTITQIPEPATMCLLGLGGLVLRRFKK